MLKSKQDNSSTLYKQSIEQKVLSAREKNQLSFLKSHEVQRDREQREQAEELKFAAHEKKKEDRLRRIVREMQKEYDGFLDHKKQRASRVKSMQRSEDLDHQSRLHDIQDKLQKA